MKQYKNRAITFVSIFAIGYFCLFSGCFGKKSHTLFKITLRERMKNNFCVTNDQDIVNFFPSCSDEIIIQKNTVISQTKELLDQIKNISRDKRTFSNTPQAFDQARALYQSGSSPISTLLYVSPNKEICTTCCSSINELTNCAIDIFYDPAIYYAFKEYIDDSNKRNEALTDEQHYFLQEVMKEFVKSGLTLPTEKFAEVKKIQKELAALEIEFEQNIAADKSAIYVTKEELAGLSEDFIKTLKTVQQNSDQKESTTHASNQEFSSQNKLQPNQSTQTQQYILTCDYPTYTEIIENCSIESTRKQLYIAFLNRACPQNALLLQRIITLRAELAKKLGFASFAHMDIDSEMAQSPEHVHDFLMTLRNKIVPKATAEIAELTKSLPKSVMLNPDHTCKPWDIKYIINEYKKKHFNLDERTVAEYFPVEQTINGIFEIYQQFLGLSFTITSPKNLWHEDVQSIEVRNKQNELLGHILLDLYPRADKFSHACEIGLLSPLITTDTVGKKTSQPSLVLIIANFPKPSADKPALLKHLDVTTFFHEFGHAMHTILSKTTLVSFAGTATKRDFVEVPSQMFEEWMWDADILKKYSHHYQTGAPLSDEIIQAKIQLKKLAQSFSINHQIINALISLQLFDENSSKNIDTTIADINTQYSIGVAYEPQTHMYCSFGHLMGYGAKYYSYLWSLVHALDLFDYIKINGLLNTEVGEKLTQDILSRGGSIDPEKLLETFLGRPSNQDALIKELLA